MDMCVRDLHPKHGYADPLAGYGSLDGLCHLLGKSGESLIGFIVQIKDIINLLLGDDQSVPLYHRVDI